MNRNRQLLDPTLEEALAVDRTEQSIKIKTNENNLTQKMLKIQICNVTNDIFESDSTIAAYYTPEHKD